MSAAPFAVGKRRSVTKQVNIFFLYIYVNLLFCRCLSAVTGGGSHPANFATSEDDHQQLAKFATNSGSTQAAIESH